MFSYNTKVRKHTPTHSYIQQHTNKLSTAARLLSPYMQNTYVELFAVCANTSWWMVDSIASCKQLRSLYINLILVQFYDIII